MKSLFEQYYPALCLFASRITGDDPMAEDIVQEAFIRLAEEMKHKDIAYCRSWLYSTVKNAAFNAIDKKKRLDIYQKNYLYHIQTNHEDHIKEIEQLIIRCEVSRELWNGVMTLPPQMRKVMELYFGEGLSVRKIAQELQLHVSSVKTQKQRGLVLLRKYLGSLHIILFIRSLFF